MLDKKYKIERLSAAKKAVNGQAITFEVPVGGDRQTGFWLGSQPVDQARSCAATSWARAPLCLARMTSARASSDS